MNFVQRVVKADPERPTRLHDLRGRPIEPRNLAHVPVALADTTLTVLTGRRRAVPWISYRATRDLGRLIQRDWHVLEFGSGMSTIWFGRRSRMVFSIESSPDWYDRVRALLAKERLQNVRLELRSSNCDRYVSIDDYDNHSFDLAFIDGDCRDACVPVCLRKVKRSGYIYLDNTDQPGDRQIAEERVLAASHEWRRYYSDFAPGLVAITEGLLIKLAN